MAFHALLRARMKGEQADKLCFAVSLGLLLPMAMLGFVILLRTGTLYFASHEFVSHALPGTKRDLFLRIKELCRGRLLWAGEGTATVI